jgi:hypothetical protein
LFVLTHIDVDALSGGFVFLDAAVGWVDGRLVELDGRERVGAPLDVLGDVR